MLFSHTVAAIAAAPGLEQFAGYAKNSSLVISPDPGIETPYAHQFAVGFDRAMGRDFSVMANFAYVRGHQQLGTIDYNPVVPSLGAGRRPNDRNGIADLFEDLGPAGGEFVLVKRLLTVGGQHSEKKQKEGHECSGSCGHTGRPPLKFL